MAELWDLYDKDRRPTGKQSMRGEPIPKGFYHLVVTIWIKNSKGQYLLSKRHPQKIFAGYWESTGGAVVAGETTLQAAVREVREELGIELNQEEGIVIYQTFREEYQDFYDAWLFHSDATLSQLILQETEVVDAGWVTRHEIDEMWDKKELHPLMSYYKDIIE